MDKIRKGISIMDVQNMRDASVTTMLAYSVEELAEKTTLSKAFLRNEIRAGRLKVQRFGRRVLILASEWQRYSTTGSEGNKPQTN